MLLPKEIELPGIAFDASYTLMYAPGTRRHTRKCVASRCKMGEIIEVLKLCVVQRVLACKMGVPILADQLVRQGSQ